MRKLILILVVLAALVVMPGMAITVEYFPDTPETYQGFVRPAVNYANNTEMLADFQSEVNGTWADMTDAEKCWEMTKFVRRHGLIASSDVDGTWTDMTSGTLHDEFNAMSNNEYGYMCLGHSALLMHLMDLYSIEAYAISAGDWDGTGWTHATVLARCNVSGHYKMIHCDPYFGDQYCYENGTPMSFFVMQDLIDTNDYDQIFKKSIGYRYDLHAITLQSFDFYEDEDYLTNTSPYIQIKFVLDDAVDNTRLWRYNNWFITPYCQATEDDWSVPYGNPYDLWGTGEVYDAHDITHSDVGIAYVEGRET